MVQSQIGTGSILLSSIISLGQPACAPAEPDYHHSGDSAMPLWLRHWSLGMEKGWYAVRTV
jgi:hypothetical protein